MKVDEKENPLPKICHKKIIPQKQYYLKLLYGTLRLKVMM